MILELIGNYIACADYMCKLLKDKYRLNETILRSRRINLLPKEGELPGKIWFNFHGSGCYFEFESGSIDIDFGPNDRCDGFDYYRLYDFLEQTKKNHYMELHDKIVFKKKFDKLVSLGRIIKPGWQPSSHLYYLQERVITASNT